MPTVTGKLLDFRVRVVSGLRPVIIFQPNKTAVTTAGTILITDPIEVTPDGLGYWTANLANTRDLLTDDVFYTVSIRWLGGSYELVDYPDWKVRVPDGGGEFSELLEQPPNARMVIVSPTRPAATYGAGVMWLQSDPNNPGSPANTGDLYEMRNA